ncbi:MAG: hypothetical protein FJZ04_03035, partial [Candidatus Moranbacteria bacterium]|nr:hypothetical protein [Candidatus Moranbacteria bacterium]
MAIVKKAAAQPTQREFEEISLRDTTRRLHRVSEEEQTAIRAAGQGLPYLDLNIFPVDTETLSILPEEVARLGRLA